MQEEPYIGRVYVRTVRNTEHAIAAGFDYYLVFPRSTRFSGYDVLNTTISSVSSSDTWKACQSREVDSRYARELTLQRKPIDCVDHGLTSRIKLD